MLVTHRYWVVTGFVKTTTALFCRLLWENDSNEGKGQKKNKDIELANNTNKNQEHESLFQSVKYCTPVLLCRCLRVLKPWASCVDLPLTASELI